jgi:death-on-curing protein
MTDFLQAADVDGNKRAGAVAALVFLDLNGIEVDPPQGAVYELAMAVASGQSAKADIVSFLRRYAP